MQSPDIFVICDNETVLMFQLPLQVGYWICFKLNFVSFQLLAIWSYHFFVNNFEKLPILLLSYLLIRIDNDQCTPWSSFSSILWMSETSLVETYFPAQSILYP